MGMKVITVPLRNVGIAQMSSFILICSQRNASVHIMNISDQTPFDPDAYLSRPRRHTDQPRPLKPTVLPTPRPNTRSFNHGSGPMDCSSLSLVSNGQNKVRIRAEDLSEAAEEPRKGSGGEVSKRVLALAVPTKRTVYTKDLDLVDTKVKLSRLRVQWPLSAYGDRKSKSTSRVRLSSPDSSFLAGAKARKSVRPVQNKVAPAQRCVSEEKTCKKTYALKGPSACKCQTVDLLLVRQYNEDQQHLLATMRDLTSGKWEQHSILRSRMQEFAPWAAEHRDKAVRFI